MPMPGAIVLWGPVPRRSPTSHHRHPVNASPTSSISGAVTEHGLEIPYARKNRAFMTCRAATQSSRAPPSLSILAMPHITLTESDQSPRVAPSTRMLHTYDINDLTLLAYDEDGSETTDRVASELIQDAYGFNGVPFESHDVVIDIGAHVGLVSLYLAKRWPSLRIHAFEPHPTNYRNAVDNLRLNDVSNVHLWHRAVTADRRSIVLRALSRNTGGATAVFDMPGA